METLTQEESIKVYRAIFAGLKAGWATFDILLEDGNAWACPNATCERSIVLRSVSPLEWPTITMYEGSFVNICMQSFGSVQVAV